MTSAAGVRPSAKPSVAELLARNLAPTMRREAPSRSSRGRRRASAAGHGIAAGFLFSRSQFD